MDYFFYAVVGGENVQAGSIGKCIDSCGKAQWMEKCCASVTMYRQSDQMKDFMYQCINRSIGSTNYTTRLDDFEVKITCTDSVNSGAKTLAAGLGAAALVGASLY